MKPDLIPNIQIIAIEDLLIYENFDDRRTSYLLDKIKSDDIFINPILVAQCKDSDKFIVLDGINRQNVLRKLGISYIVAQVVDYFDENQISLLSNKHFFFELDENLIEKIKSLVGSNWQEINPEEAEELVERQRIIGYVGLDSKCFSFGNHESLVKTTNILNSIVDLYLNDKDFSRLSESMTHPSGVKMEIGFRRFSPEEICNFFELSICLNSGITFHRPEISFLHVNMPLSLLGLNNDLKTKNLKLKENINNIINNKNYRYYSQSVFICNER